MNLNVYQFHTAGVSVSVWLRIKPTTAQDLAFKVYSPMYVPTVSTQKCLRFAH